MQTNELCGILPVNKPENWTSFDVVGKLRGVLKTKKIGHGGTLDPMAVGVLPVFVGKAAKCCDILPDKSKGYTAGFKLGISTDTQDISGTVTNRSDRSVSDDTLCAALHEFEGDILQIPPMYSAVKVNGKKLYELAREGKTIERSPRPCHVDKLTLLSFDENTREGTLAVECAQGTYVRTIINDIGDKLGTGGTMTSLVRTRSGGFSLDECLTLDEIITYSQQNKISEILLPVDRVFSVYPICRLDEHSAALYKNGVRLRRGQFTLHGSAEKYRVYAPDGFFLGLGSVSDGVFHSIKNFY